MLRKLIYSGIILIVITGLAAGSFAFMEQAEAADEEVALGYVNWACTEAKTYVAKAALEEKMGLEVTTSMVDAGPVYASLATGDVDAFLSSWLPVTHHHYVEEYQDEIVKAGVNFFGARIGLVVPEYVDIDSVKELNEYRDKFDGEIIGIDPGAGIMEATHEAIDHYDFELDLISSSGPAMAASLKDAIENEEWIVVTGWEPHWKFARFDLKFLEDPDQIYGEIEHVYTITRQDLGADNPRLVSFFHDFRMTGEQLGEVMGWIEDGVNRVEAGQRWVEENSEIVEDWTKPHTISE